MKLVFGGTKKVRGINASETPQVSYTPLAKTTTITGTPTTVTVKDTIQIQTTGSFENTMSQKINVLNINTDLAIQDIIVENLSPTVATLDPITLLLDPLAYGGIVDLKVSSKLTTTKLLTSVSRNAYAGVYSVLSEFLVGSLRRHIKDQVFGVISGKVGWNPYNGLGIQSPVPLNNQYFDSMQPIDSTTPTRHQLVYYTNDNITYTRSALHILNGIDITGINNQYYDTIHNTSGGTATLISPRHVFSAAHWHPVVGSSIKWVDANSIVYTRTVVSEWVDYSTDHWVGLLDSDLPSSIKPLKVFPSNYLTYLPAQPFEIGGIPAYSIFTSYNMITLGVYTDRPPYIATGGMGGSFEKVISPIQTGVTDYYDAITSFQWNGVFGSGTPVFTVINNEAVLLFCYWYGGYAGCNVHNNLTAINAGMHSLSVAAGLVSDYQLTPVTLTGFNTY